MKLFTADILPKLEIEHAATVGKHISILGMTGSGKTNTAFVWIEEELNAGGKVIIIDPEGEFHVLKERYPILIVGKSRRDNPVDLELSLGQGAAAANALASRNVSIILDLSGLDIAEQNEMATEFLSALWRQYLDIDLPPCRVVIDEAHLFAPQGKGTASKDLIQNIASRGRKYGFALLVATQRPQRIDKTILDSTSIRFFQWMKAGAGLNAVADLVPGEFKARDTIPALARGQCIFEMERIAATQHVRAANTFHPGRDASAISTPAAIIDAALLDGLRALLSPNHSAAPATKSETTTPDAAAQLREVIARQGKRITELEAELETLRNAPQWKIVPKPDLVVQGGSPTVVDQETVIDDTDQRTPRATARAVNMQQRKFDQLLRSLSHYPVHYRVLLKYLVDNDTREYPRRLLARYTGYQEETIINKPPLPLIKEGLIVRRGSGSATMYQSAARQKLERDFPDLNVDALIGNLLAACH